MKIAIMQPYLFPYIGYFQLIQSVDKFIIFDDVNYIKGGWVNRNNILLNGKTHLFTLPIYKASSNKLINQIDIFNGPKEKKRILKTLDRGYKKAPEYINVFPLIKDIMDNSENNLSKFIEYSLISVSAYLDIKTEFIRSSMLDKKNAKGKELIINICKLLSANIYVNPNGGRSLYNKMDFKRSNIDLFFIKMGNVRFRNNLSIIDILFLYDKDKIKHQINNYDLI